MGEEVVWFVGGLAGFWLLNRLLTELLLRRAIKLTYRNDLDRVLNAKEHRVKGRFD